MLDPHWNTIQTYRGSEPFLASFDARNIVELTLGAWRPLIDNWTPVAARFESVADITLDELRVELTYPEDDTSERYSHDRLTHG